MKGMELKKVVSLIENFSPLSFAQSWDNVGLLVEPKATMTINKIMLTNDLTEEVMNECVEKKTDMIISYHPPIFKPLTRLTTKSWKERVIISCVNNQIALYSPHTSFDSVDGGVNDWLLKPFGNGSTIPLEEDGMGIGPGRLLFLNRSLNLNDAIDKLKKHLGLPNLRLALGNGTVKENKIVKTIAVCAGSGGSLLRKHKADLWITGELSHHEVLDAVHHGTSVILCEHSNSERGFLIDVFVEKLTTILENQVQVEVSKKDKDPLVVV